MNFEPKLDQIYPLRDVDGWPESIHRFEQRHVFAIQAAIACGRPLLIRGEPGIGKSQLARAAASFLKVPFLCHTMTADAECRDLLYHFDAVERLAQAQVLSKVGSEDWKAQLAPERFVSPGVLWWAFNWRSAKTQCTYLYDGDLGTAAKLIPKSPETWSPEHKGCVLLIDEIDKADGDVPNALLESLGSFAFNVPEAAIRVELGNKPRPLVVITTNEERELPRAFLRRCLVLQMDFNKELLLKRGSDHFGESIHPEIYEQAADLLLEDRQNAPGFGPVTPGLAEYLDFLNIISQCEGVNAQRERMRQARHFVGCKNPRQHRSVRKREAN